LQIKKDHFTILLGLDVPIFMSVLLLILVFLSSSYSFQGFAISPAFDESLISDLNRGNNGGSDWIQTHGNETNQLMSDYANILAVNYFSNGQTLNTTLWLASNAENASIYDQPFKTIRYGMLIAIVTLPENSGFNGANYDYYIESVNGTWSEYLYQLSSTGARALVASNTNYTDSFGGSSIGPGYVNLRLDLETIHSPGNYGLSFYATESYKSNEIRDYTSWIAVPPPTIDILTEPKNIVLRQGEEQLIPSEFETPLSDNVTSITFDNSPTYSYDGLDVSAERIHPTLFKIKVSPQSPVGVYNIPVGASMLIQTTSSKLPAFNDTVTGSMHPEFEVSKKYPTIGYITTKANLTIEVLPPLTPGETFMGYWHTWGDAIALIAAGAVGAFATFAMDILKSRRGSSK
jgi:hypothetical protein